MPLSRIPPDRQPTDAEVAPYRKKWSDGTPFGERAARFFWQCDEKRKRPDDFQVPWRDWIGCGFSRADYDQYLAGPLWLTIRNRVIAAAGGKCAACQNSATEVHHRDYRPRVMEGRDDSLLVALCRGCHQRVHFDGKRARDSWNEEDAMLNEMVAAKEGRRLVSRRLVR